MHKVGDNLYAGNAGWSFGNNVATVFDEHIRKSVPFYDAGHGLIVKMGDFFLPNGSTCIEVGCSTGNLLAGLAERNKEKDIRILGIDKEVKMVEEARKKCRKYGSVEVECQDIIDFDFSGVDLVISYYTMQFVQYKWRQEVINRIYAGLNPGGGFIFFEKVHTPYPRFQDMFGSLQNEYKLEKGYTPEEILGKAASLRGILEPLTSQENEVLLQDAGFRDTTIIFKYLCWEGLVSVK
ncbi:MAG: methyltransferase domain-containing protein [Thermodesulfobacteriota bacterium]|nr:methyltransferase domain-containing protein [Thermodesulfobacteriota bacterium]